MTVVDSSLPGASCHSCWCSLLPASHKSEARRLTCEWGGAKVFR